MASLRKPLQGVGNIIRFNWHFYVLFAVGVAAIILLKIVLPVISNYVYVAIVPASLTVFTSLMVSWYVYDFSNLYTLNWLDKLLPNQQLHIVNINAGFDEFSELLQAKFPNVQLTVLDFYDANKHTEVSIKRARMAYPPYPGTIAIQTDTVPLQQSSFDTIYILLAAHEIRNGQERSLFFQQLSNALKQDGRIVVTEHLRDVPNLLAYNIGAFHFHTHSSWLATFSAAGLQVEKEQKITPFITTFVLRKHGASS